MFVFAITRLNHHHNPFFLRVYVCGVADPLFVMLKDFTTTPHFQTHGGKSLWAFRANLAVLNHTPLMLVILGVEWVFDICAQLT